MTYLEFCNQLNAYAESDFAGFQKRLIFTQQEILGVRTPILRKLAKTYQAEMETILSFPDTYYETAFIKLAMLSSLPYDKFVERVEYGVSLMDNWATCDCFKAKCIKDNKDDFLHVLERLFLNRGAFYQRYVLVTLLTYYAEEKYVSVIEKYITLADTELYYVHMAVAWLIAELLIKCYDKGVRLLQKNIVDKKTHNKAIQKAIESFRLSKEQKAFLRALKK